MFGKMSVGVRRSTRGVINSNAMAATKNVYGRLSASWTIHMGGRLGLEF